MKKGISLVALVITIIVLIILTAAVILTATNSNIFGKSEEAVFKSDVTAFQEELTKSILEEQLKDNTFDTSTINADTAADVAKWIPSIAGTKYEGNFVIEGGKLKYSGNNTNEQTYASSVGIGLKTITSSDTGASSYKSYSLNEEEFELIRQTLSSSDFLIIILENKDSDIISMVSLTKDGPLYFPDFQNTNVFYGEGLDDGVNKYDYVFMNNDVLTEVDAFPILTNVRILSNEEIMELSESVGQSISVNNLFTANQLSQILTEVTE